MMKTTATLLGTVYLGLVMKAVLVSRLYFITITCPCNVDLLIPHFYIAKLAYAGVYLFFLFLLQNIDCGWKLFLCLGGSIALFTQDCQ